MSFHENVGKRLLGLDDVEIPHDLLEAFDKSLNKSLNVADVAAALDASKLNFSKQMPSVLSVSENTSRVRRLVSLSSNSTLSTMSSQPLSLTSQQNSSLAAEGTLLDDVEMPTFLSDSFPNSEATLVSINSSGGAVNCSAQRDLGVTLDASDLEQKGSAHLITPTVPPQSATTECPSPERCANDWPVFDDNFACEVNLMVGDEEPVPTDEDPREEDGDLSLLDNDIWNCDLFPLDSKLKDVDTELEDSIYTYMKESKFMQDLIPKKQFEIEKKPLETLECEEVTESKPIENGTICINDADGTFIAKNPTANTTVNVNSANGTFTTKNPNATFDQNNADATFDCRSNAVANATFDGAAIAPQNLTTIIQNETHDVDTLDAKIENQKVQRSKVTFGPECVIPDAPKRLMTDFERLQDMVASASYVTDVNKPEYRAANSTFQMEESTKPLNSTYQHNQGNVNTTFDSCPTGNSVEKMDNNATFKAEDCPAAPKVTLSLGGPRFSGTPIKKGIQNSTFDCDNAPDVVLKFEHNVNSTFDADSNNAIATHQSGAVKPQNATFNQEVAANNITFDHEKAAEGGTFIQDADDSNSFNGGALNASPINKPSDVYLNEDLNVEDGGCRNTSLYRSYSMPASSPDEHGLNESLHQLCQSQSYSCLNLMDAEPPVLKHILKLDPLSQDQLKNRFDSPANKSFPRRGRLSVPNNFTPQASPCLEKPQPLPPTPSQGGKGKLTTSTPKPSKSVQEILNLYRHPTPLKEHCEEPESEITNMVNKYIQPETKGNTDGVKSHSQEKIANKLRMNRQHAPLLRTTSGGPLKALPYPKTERKQPAASTPDNGDENALKNAKREHSSSGKKSATTSKLPSFGSFSSIDSDRPVSPDMNNLGYIAESPLAKGLMSGNIRTSSPVIGSLSRGVSTPSPLITNGVVPPTPILPPKTDSKLSAKGSLGAIRSSSASSLKNLMLKQNLLKNREGKPTSNETDNLAEGVTNMEPIIEQPNTKEENITKSVSKNEASENSLLDLDVLPDGPLLEVSHKKSLSSTPNQSLEVSSNSSSSKAKKITPSKIPCLNGKSPVNSPKSPLVKKQTPTLTDSSRKSSVADTPTSTKSLKMPRKNLTAESSLLHFSSHSAGHASCDKPDIKRMSVSSPRLIRNLVSNFTEEMSPPEDLQKEDNDVFEKEQYDKMNSTVSLKDKSDDINPSPYVPIIRAKSELCVKGGESLIKNQRKASLKSPAHSKPIVSSTVQLKKTLPATMKPLSNLKKPLQQANVSKLNKLLPRQSLLPSKPVMKVAPRLQRQTNVNIVRKPLVRKSLLPPNKSEQTAVKSSPLVPNKALKASIVANKAPTVHLVPNKAPLVPNKAPTVPLVPNKAPTVPLVPNKAPTVPLVPNKAPTVPLVPNKAPTVPLVPKKAPTVTNKISTALTKKLIPSYNVAAKKENLVSSAVSKTVDKSSGRVLKSPSTTAALPNAMNKLKPPKRVQYVANKENLPTTEDNTVANNTSAIKPVVKQPLKNSNQLPEETLKEQESKAVEPKLKVRDVPSKIQQPSRLRPPGGIPRPSGLPLPSKLKMPGSLK